MLVERTRLKTGFSLVRPAIQPFFSCWKKTWNIPESPHHDHMRRCLLPSTKVNDWKHITLLEREEKEDIFGRGDKRVYLDEKSRSLSHKTKEKETTLPLRSVALNSLFSFMMIMSFVHISAVVVCSFSSAKNI